MDAVEKQYRAERYRIEMYRDTNDHGYAQYVWVKYWVYRPRKWFRGFFHYRSSFVCGNSLNDAYARAESEAKKIIAADIERRYNKKHKIKNDDSKTVYVAID